MKSSSSEHDERDQKLINILKDLGTFHSAYPSALLAARRAAFLEQVERLGPSEAVEEVSPGDQEIVKLLGRFRTAPVEYPADLLAARRSAFLRQMERPRRTSLWDRFHAFLQRVFPSQKKLPSSSPGFVRLSLVAASVAAALCIGSLFLSRMDAAVRPAPSQAAVTPSFAHPTGTLDVAITICKPGEQASACPPGELDPSQDLADAGNGLARPAVSKDARAHPNGVYEAAYVNDGRSGSSWVSESADSWIKIDLGKVTTMNMVSLQSGSLDSAGDGDLGPFEIAMAVSDEYADGDSSHDDREYVQVLRSEQAGVRGPVSPAETIQIRFPLVQARFVKITFAKAGAAVEEVGVFLVEPEFTEQRTGTPPVEVPVTGVTASQTNTPSPIDTATPASTSTSRSTLTTVPTLTKTPPPSGTPIPPPTNTISPTDTPLPLPTSPLPSDTPIPLPTLPLPTIVPPTSVAPTAVLPTVSSDPIIVTGSDQDLSFVCNGNVVEIHGHANSVILLGSCSRITVTGNGNHVYWQFGSPVITDRGNDNIIEQL